MRRRAFTGSAWHTALKAVRSWRRPWNGSIGSCSAQRFRRFGAVVV
jgi:hypothetical protein